MLTASVISGCVAAGLFMRGRHMLAVREWIWFGTGLAMIAAGVVGGLIGAKDAERPQAHIFLFGLWGFWVSALGLALVACALGTWWLREERSVRAGSKGSVVLSRGCPHFLDWAAVLLLPVGGVVPFAGWLPTILLVWTSRVWTAREKMIATLALPGGPVVVILAVGELEGSRRTGLAVVVGTVFAALLAFVPLAAAVLLAARARAARTALAAAALGGAFST